MFDAVELVPIVRNLFIYAVGVGLAGAGALGLVDAIGLPAWLAWSMLVAGLAVVVSVHEYLGGPV